MSDHRTRLDYDETNKTIYTCGTNQMVRNEILPTVFGGFSNIFLGRNLFLARTALEVMECFIPLTYLVEFSLQK